VLDSRLPRLEIKKRKKIMKNMALVAALLTSFSLQATTLNSLSGVWKLTQITMDGASIKCPDQFSLPPGVPAIVTQFSKCGDSETLTIQSKNGRGTFNTTLTVLNALTSPNGFWASEKISKIDYITFVDAALRDDPRTYVYSLSKDKKTLTISETMEVYNPVTGGLSKAESSLVFVRTN
jgi:hypothetical protein